MITTTPTTTKTFVAVGEPFPDPGIISADISMAVFFRRVSEAVDWNDIILHAEESVVPGIHLPDRQRSDVARYQSVLPVHCRCRLLRRKRRRLQHRREQNWTGVH